MPELPEPDPPPAKRCPWCDDTDTVLKKVLHHMESAHPQRWRDLVLAPPVAGGR
jgi:hypothetical protein